MRRTPTDDARPRQAARTGALWMLAVAVGALLVLLVAWLWNNGLQPATQPPAGPQIPWGEQQSGPAPAPGDGNPDQRQGSRR